MHNAYFSSSIYCLRTKGYLSNDCSYLLNERFERNPIRASSLLASASCCCDCCAFPTHRVVSISPCYLYGLRQSSLLQWSASRRLAFGGRDRYYSRVQECIPGPDCYEVSCCFRERSVYNRRGRRGKGKCCCNEEGESEVYDSGDYGDVEAVLSLLSEEVGEECFGRERNVISFKRAELEGKKSLGGRQRNVSSSKRVEEDSRRILGCSKRNVSSLKRVEEEKGRSLSGGTRNMSSLRRVEEESRRNLSGGTRNVSSSRRVEEESRRHLSGSTRNVSSSSKRAETERNNFGGREKVESSSKGVQVDFEGNDSGECYSWEKKSNGRRLNSFESNSKRQLESATVEVSERDSRHKEERGILSRGENHGVRKEGSSCSSYYSFSSSGDLGSEADVLDKHGLLEEPGSSVYKDSQYDRGGRSDERVSEVYKNYKDDAKGKREMSKQTTTAIEGGVMWDWGKKSEKKLTDAVIEETHASRKSSEMHSRVFKTNESELAKASGSRKQSDDEKENSYLIKGTKERYGQTVNQDVGENESRRKFHGGKEELEIYRTGFGTTSLAQDRHSDREEHIDVAINLVPETKEEHYKTTGYVTQAKDVNRDTQKFSGISQVQVVDTERTSNWRRQSDTRINNHKESTSMGIGSVDETEAECYQIGHEIDQKAQQKVQSREGTNTVDETLVHASDTATNTNSQRISMKRNINQDTVSAATLVEETRLRNTQTDENLMQVKSRKGAQSSTKVSSSHEKDPGETSSFQTTLSMVSQGGMQQHDVEGSKRTPQALLMPPPSQLIARGLAYNESLSETTTQEVSVEISESGSALNYDSGSGNANPETQGEILYLTNPEDALGSGHRSEESSSQFVGEFFNKVRQEVSTSENQNDNNEQRTSTLHQESSSGNGNNETPGKTFELTNPEDALGSAHRLEKSSSQFAGEFSEKVRQTASTSEEQRAEMVSEAKLLLGGEKYGQRISSQYGSKDSQLKENDSKRSSGGSGTKGPSVEMWDVTDTSTLQSPKEEPKEEKLEATTSEKSEATTTSGNAIAKRTGRSIWNIVADIVKLRWSSHNGTHCSTARSGERISSNEYASSEAWFSGHEPDDNSEKNVKWDNGTQPEATSDQLQPAKSLFPGVESLGPNDIQKNYQGSSSGIQVVESSQPLLASGMKSPFEEEISRAGNTVSGSGSVSDDVQKGGELKQRRFQRNKQVVKDRFDEWEEAHNLEIEQRKTDEMFMREALLEAKKAADTWEVPVGAVLVQQGKIIARGYNLVEELRDSTAHAEMICIREASNVLRTWRLSETTLYVTLEPCPMCAGAILQARVQTVVWGAPNKLLGADGSWIRLFPDGGRGDDLEHSDKPAAPVHPFHPNMTIRRGVLASECADTMQQFFQLRRKKKEKRQADTPAPPPTTIQSSHHPSKILAKVHDIFHMMFCL